MSERYIPQIAILGSPEPEGGATAEAVARQLHAGNPLLNFNISLVVASSLEAGILERAENWNKTWGWSVQPGVAPNSIGSPSETIMDLADEHDIDLVVSLGFRTKLTDPFIEAYGYTPTSAYGPTGASVYEARAINLHPGSVPLTSGTIGRAATELELAAYRRGKLKIAQCVGHAISRELDDPQGVFDRRYVPILHSDTVESLHARKRRFEQAAAPYMIQKFLEQQQRESLL